MRFQLRPNPEGHHVEGPCASDTIYSCVLVNVTCHNDPSHHITHNSCSPYMALSPCAKRCPRGGGNFSLMTEVLHNHSEMSLSGVFRGSASLDVKLLQSFHEGKTAGFRRTPWSAHKPPSLLVDQEPFHLQPCYYHHCGCILSFLLIQPCTVHNSLY